MNRSLIALTLTTVWAVLPPAAFGVGTAFFPQSVASGDPTADSVVLWTRLVDGDSSSDRSVALKVVSSGSLDLVGTTAELEGANLHDGGLLTAQSAYDGCVKTIITGLEPATSYFFQFSYLDEDTTRYSAIGRTRTAPPATAQEDIRFAVFNCSDYSGRYYNTLKHLVDHESDSLDFVLHLGDYLYETTADPSFQIVDPNRLVSFLDEQGALDFGNFFAARSLSNYRELYKTYRNDPNLMAAHERFPWVMIWDDHEYSDDNFGATATFFDGKIDEADEIRKRNAEKAWLEFVPCALGLNDGKTALDFQDDDLYPNLDIYRSLNFGSHLDLILTDNRTNRVDHLIPEDSFPGTIAVDQTTAEALLTQLGTPASALPGLISQFDPYLDLDGSHSYFGVPAGDYSGSGHPAFAGTPFAGQTFKNAFIAIVQQAAASELAATPVSVLDPSTIPARSLNYAQEKVTGNLSATWINQLFSIAGFPTAPFSNESLAKMPRGISFQLFGKAQNFTDTGSRYQVVHSPFALYALSLAFNEANEGTFYDLPQQQFLSEALATAVGTWKVVASSSPFTPIRLNLGTPTAELNLPNKARIGDGPEVSFPFPDLFKQDFLVNADEVAGFPVFRQGIVDLLAQHDAVLVSGDIHASMLGTNQAQNGETVVDFTAPSTSSSKFRRAFSGAITAIESLLAAQVGDSFQFNQAQVDNLLAKIDGIVVDSSPELSYLNTETHGYLLVEANATRLLGEFREIDTNNIAVDHQMLTPEGIDSIFTRKVYHVTKNGAADLEVAAGPVVVALAKTNKIKVGDQVVIPNVVTEPGKTYRVTFSSNLKAPFSGLSPEALVSVNGSSFERGEIAGTDSTISIVVKIPDKVASVDALFFRVEEVTD